MSTPIRPIRIPGAAAHESMQQSAQIALSAWGREWLSGCASGERSAPSLRIRALDRKAMVARAEYCDCVRTDAGCMWFRSSAADHSRLGDAVVGAELLSRAGYIDEWVATALERAWHARNSAVCAALLGIPVEERSAATLDVSVFAFGSGAVQVTSEELGLHAIADSGVWRSVAPTQRNDAQGLAALAPIDRAMSGATVRLNLMLGSVEIDLPRLLDLHCGDVLRLPQRLDEDISVFCESKVLARAILGEVKGRKCVQVVGSDPHQVRQAADES